MMRQNRATCLFFSLLIVVCVVPTLASADAQSRAPERSRRATARGGLKWAGGLGPAIGPQPAPRIRALMPDGRAAVFASLADVAAPEDVYSLSIRSPGFNDAESEELIQFSRVKTLSLPGFADRRSSELTDAGLRKIARLPHLEALSLGSDLITDFGIAELAPLRSLSCLSVRSPLVTDQGAGLLAAMPHLRDLYLSAPRVTDLGIAALARCSTLRSVCVCGCAVTGVGFESFRGHEGLAHIAGEFTIDGLKIIGRLDNSITSIAVFGSGATDASLLELAKLPRLRRVNLFGSRITNDGVNRFLARAGAHTRVTRDVNEAVDDVLKELEQLEHPSDFRGKRAKSAGHLSSGPEQIDINWSNSSASE